jgi:hypothetical protein
MSCRRAPSRAALAVLALIAAAVPARAQLRAGPEFRANAYTTGNQLFPGIAVEPEGEFVVVWASYGQDGDDYGIFGRAFRDDGSPRGNEFRANTYTTLSQSVPFAAHDGNEFVVVWTSHTQDGDLDGVFARRFRKDGTPEGGEFQVNTTTTGDQDATSVAKDRREGSRGGFVVAWTDFNVNSGDVRARRYDANGVAQTGEIPVNAYTTDLQTGGRLAAAADGRFVVIWASYGQDGASHGVFGRRFAATGAPFGGEFQVNSVGSGDEYPGGVAMADDGRFVVAFQQDDGSGNGVFARRFDAGGNAIGLEFQANSFTPGEQYRAGVAMNQHGDFVVTWGSQGQDGSYSGVFGQRFDKNGVRVGSEFRVNTYTTDEQALARVSMDEVGNFTVAWSSYSQDGSGWGVYAQRFGGILFPGVTVDQTPNLGPLAPQAADGNGVLEPGETAKIETSWKNVTGFAQTLTGFVQSFTGPPGPTYTVPDPFANFGTIPNGVTQSCAVTGDCYVVGVSAGPRPVTHWDGTMTEGPALVIFGQAKLWAIHVGESFTDVPKTSPFYKFIETLLHWRITGGCTASEYCPGSTTTREQMAAFVVAAASGPLFVPAPCGPTPMFADVPIISPFCPSIEELARRGVVAGCAPTLYCPNAAVTREQMAVFVLRGQDGAANPPACGTPIFNDVPASSPFCRWIEELARRGVVTGCGGGNYCPAAPVTREQMAVFIAGTFALALYGA